MGKKKIVTNQGGEPASDAKSEASVSKKASSKRQVINGVAHISVSYNNTIVTITDLRGEVIAWSSAGSMGFKGTKKSTPYAANLVAKECTEKAKKYNLSNIKIVVKGIGPGREAAMRGLAATGLNIISIMDATPVAHNGIRAKKPRRI
jgi:small subunit ribosomal protein S11